MKSKKRTVIFLAAAGALISTAVFCSAVVLANFNRTLSPDKKHKTTYNCWNHTVKTEHFENRSRTYEALDRCASYCTPDFIWSPDSRYLVIAYQDADNRSKMNVADVVNHKGFSVIESNLLAACGKTETEENNMDLHFVEWLDSEYALIKFEWEHPTTHESGSGWFTWQAETGQILDLHTVSASSISLSE